MGRYQLNNNVFREYVIRGIVEEDFPPDFIYDLGIMDEAHKTVGFKPAPALKSTL